VIDCGAYPASETVFVVRSLLGESYSDRRVVGSPTGEGVTVSQLVAPPRPAGARCPVSALPPGLSPWLLVPAGPRPPVRVATAAEDALLVSAHGGSGASTLAGLHPGLVEATEWSGNWSVPVVVVCRSNAAGSVAAGRLLEDHREAPALGALVVADAPGRLPVALARRVRLLGGVTVGWRVPWVETWRRRGPAGPAPAGWLGCWSGWSPWPGRRPGDDPGAPAQ